MIDKERILHWLKNTNAAIECRFDDNAYKYRDYLVNLINKRVFDKKIVKENFHEETYTNMHQITKKFFPELYKIRQKRIKNGQCPECGGFERRMEKWKWKEIDR